nr:NAD(P)/FAD-dependent oxidoreductase [Clostridioides difficile]
MYKILKKHGHTLNKLYPALVPLTIEKKSLLRNFEVVFA